MRSGGDQREQDRAPAICAQDGDIPTGSANMDGGNATLERHGSDGATDVRRARTILPV